MSRAACKQAMCAAWPHPAEDKPVRGHKSREAERAVRTVLLSSAYLGQAEAHKEDPDWIATIEAIGHTPMRDEQIKTAQVYIHKLAEM